MPTDAGAIVTVDINLHKSFSEPLYRTGSVLGWVMASDWMPTLAPGESLDICSEVEAALSEYCHVGAYSFHHHPVGYSQSGEIYVTGQNNWSRILAAWHVPTGIEAIRVAREIEVNRDLYFCPRSGMLRIRPDGPNLPLLARLERIDKGRRLPAGVQPMTFEEYKSHA